MAPVLILKTGQTLPGIAGQLGDFEDWIIAVSGAPATAFSTVSVFAGEPLPAVDSVSGVIVTGSPAMVTDPDAWIRDSEAFLRTAVARCMPVLGICFGHQLLAQALGGVVDFHPQGREIGTADITTLPESSQDALFGPLPSQFPAHVTHMQCVMSLPESAVVLAGNSFDPHHGVRFADKAWGVQFHPEFNAEIMSGYLTERFDQVCSEGLDAAGLLAQVKDTPAAAALLQRFAGFCL